MQLLGCDFSSAPSKRKPIVIALGHAAKGQVRVEQLLKLESLAAYQSWLDQDLQWVGGFDMPFGLPRELVLALGWPTAWDACMQHYGRLTRAQIRAEFSAFCNARPVGDKFAHRATDGPAGSSTSMKWVNPPVAYMLHAGVPCLQQAGAYLPGIHRPALQNPPKVALETYPGLLAREVLGNRSYKSDDKARQTPERLIARKDLVHALESGQTRLGLRLKLSPVMADGLVADASGDALDAVLCLVQAAWAWQRHQEGDALYGLPADMDPLEGWIVTA